MNVATRLGLARLLAELGPEDLCEAGRMLKEAFDAKERERVRSFAVGDAVQFEYKGTTVRGVFRALNQKTVAVDAVDGRAWRISPGLLKKQQ
jgi:hypothetical protein